MSIPRSELPNHIKDNNLYFSDDCKNLIYTNKMNSILFEWLDEVFTELMDKYSNLNYYEGVNRKKIKCKYTIEERQALSVHLLSDTKKLLDVKLKKNNGIVNIKMIQCMGIACFYIAWGINIDEIIYLSDLVYLTNGTTTLAIVKNVVIDILKDTEYGAILLNII